MIIQRVQSGNVNQRIEINAAEIDAFLKTSDGEELIQPVYRLLHARLDVPETLDFEAAKTQVEVLGDRIKQGEEFNQVIASSEEPYLFTGGDLGLRPESDIPSLFAELVPTMQEGESQGPIINGRSVHFIYLAENAVVPRSSHKHRCAIF